MIYGPREVGHDIIECQCRHKQLYPCFLFLYNLLLVSSSLGNEPLAVTPFANNFCNNAGPLHALAFSIDCAPFFSCKQCRLVSQDQSKSIHKMDETTCNIEHVERKYHQIGHFLMALQFYIQNLHHHFIRSKNELLKYKHSPCHPCPCPRIEMEWLAC